MHKLETHSVEKLTKHRLQCTLCLCSCNVTFLLPEEKQYKGLMMGEEMAAIFYVTIAVLTHAQYVDLIKGMYVFIFTYL